MQNNNNNNNGDNGNGNNNQVNSGLNSGSNGNGGSSAGGSSAGSSTGDTTTGMSASTATLIMIVFAVLAIVARRVRKQVCSEAPLPSETSRRQALRGLPFSRAPMLGAPGCFPVSPFGYH